MSLERRVARGFESPEPGSGYEKMKEPRAKIELHFFRHDDKEKDPNKSNEDQLLTEQGRKNAFASGEAKKITQAVAFGSPRPRAQETAGLRMAPKGQEITGEENLDELREKFDATLGMGSKIGVDRRLDFVNDSDTELGRALHQAYVDGQYLGYTVEQSDKVAQESGDTKNFTYSRSAADMADIVLKYVKVLPRWSELVADKDKDYSEIFERFLGSHQGVTETFLLKVVEKTEGKERRDELVEALGNAGFGFSEGYEVEIEDKDGEPVIKITFDKKDEEGQEIFHFDKEIDLDLVREIASERI